MIERIECSKWPMIFFHLKSANINFYESVEWSRAKELRKKKGKRASGKCVTISAGEKVLYEERKQRSTKANKINDAFIPQVLPLAAGTYTHRWYPFSVCRPVWIQKERLKFFFFFTEYRERERECYSDATGPWIRILALTFLCSSSRCLCAHFVNVNNNNGRLLWVSLKTFIPDVYV